ncbi:MAG: hypothetical protein H6745_16980 [Deltaproteobacteria bacterium]|nr:hypothetical protein [Deltaproteobacteria bacterium]
MKLRHGLLLWVAAALALLALGGGRADVLAADEVDALEAGVVLAERLTATGPPFKERLAEGFATPPEDARAAAIPGDQPARRAAVNPPLTRWAVAGAVMASPSATATNLERAGWGAALWVALALVLIAAVAGWQGGGGVFSWWLAAGAAGALLVMPGVLEAASAAGSAAVGLAAMALLMFATERCLRGAAALPVGVAWGLALGCHPGAVFLLIPVFAAYIVARPAQGPPSTLSGEGRLPTAPLGLLAAPVVGLVTLVAMWPALWTETGKRLGGWLMDTWWTFNPPYDVAGTVFDQAHDRAAMAWTGLVQWAAWTPLPVLALFVVGLGVTIRRGRAGAWASVLAWLTVILVGAGDGGLFGGRLSLLPFLWAPTAVIAGVGLVAVVAFAREHVAGSVARAVALGGAVAAFVAALAVALPGMALRGGVGDELRWPLPLDLLREIAAEAPYASVRCEPAGPWRRAVDVVADHADIPIAWGEGGRAWSCAVGTGAVAVPGVYEGVVDGVPWRASPPPPPAAAPPPAPDPPTAPGGARRPERPGPRPR